MSVSRILRAASTAALLCFCAAAAPGAAKAMEFSVVPFSAGSCGAQCPEVIGATGEITSSTPDEFLAFVQSHVSDRRLRSIVLIHSPGGSVVGSMKLGLMFRKTGVAAVVARASAGGVGAGSCYSACVYAFMGGGKRVVPPQSRIGVHRMSYEDFERDFSTLEYRARAHYGTPDAVGQLSNYARSMGVSGEAIAVAERVSPNEIHIVTPSELRRWRLGQQKF